MEMARKVAQKDYYLISPDEARFISNTPSSSDLAKSKRVLSDVLTNALKSKTLIKTQSGKVMQVSAAELLVASKLAWDIKNPAKVDLVQYSKAMGEQQNSTLDVNVNFKPSEIFGKIDAGVIEVEPVNKKEISSSEAHKS
jgi:hypothetical protein